MASALRNRIAGWAVTRRVSRRLTGDYEDLRHLIGSVRGRAGASAGLAEFLRTIADDIDTARTGPAALFARLGRELNPRAKRQLVRNLIYNWAAQGARRRNELAAAGLWVPSFVVLSPTMRCNLKCTGCYAGLYSKRGELSEADIRRVLDECRSFGAYFVVVSGGEPYLLKDMWLRLFREYDDLYFLTYTNGTLLDQATVDELARLGNVAPGISVEGYGDATDARRGEGVYEKVLAAAARLRRAGVLFGVSVTYTRQNLSEVTSDAFVEHWVDEGAIFAWYFMFMPVGKDPMLDLVPTPEQRVMCGERIAALRRRHPVFLADFWNDGPASAGCLAARTYLHILNSGQVEPCVFAHFGLDNIRTKSIVEAVNSPFFRAIRREFPYNENGNLRRPCMIVDNPQVLRKVVAEHLVPAGHVHSEDVVNDPAVVSWIDDYAARLKDLTDPLWEKQINDPSDRWYAGGQEYRNLFRFRPPAGG